MFLCMTFATLLQWPPVSAAASGFISITQCINYVFRKFEGLKLIYSSSCSGVGQEDWSQGPFARTSSLNHNHLYISYQRRPADHDCKVTGTCCPCTGDTGVGGGGGALLSVKLRRACVPLMTSSNQLERPRVNAEMGPRPKQPSLTVEQLVY